MKRLLLAIARFRWTGQLVGWGFENMSFAIPVDRLVETDTLLAFHHPSPAYPLHILLVPKRQIATLSAISDTDIDVIAELFAVVRELVKQFELEEHGYRLVANGGPYQDVKQVHFHLTSDK